jgi:hypothetical protein
MGSHASGVRELKRWEDEPFSEAEGIKLMRSSVNYVYQGDIEGKATLAYVMLSGTGSTVTFIGMEQVVGRVGSRSGSFVLKHTGEMVGGDARVSWTVVPGSGTGELVGLRGEGGFETSPEERGNASYTLDYELG